MEIRRFGVGHRRPDGPPGTRRVQGRTIHSDSRGVLAELALDRGGSISPHSNPNLVYFLVIEGGGFVRVGDETARVAAGDAVVWPPELVHSAWTEVTPMRAIVVEFARLPADRETRLLEPGTGALAEEAAIQPGSIEATAGRSGGDSTSSGTDEEPHGSSIARDGEPW